VSFHPKGSNGKDGLSVVAFYANQTLVEKLTETISAASVGFIYGKRNGCQLRMLFV
jgi:hypothetical protein